MTIALTAQTVETPIGAFILVADDKGVIRAADFSDCDFRLRMMLDRRLGRQGYRVARGGVSPGHTNALAAYFRGDLAALACIPVATSGSPFQESVWAALRTTEAGLPITYAMLASQLGRSPNASRAVGHANSTNPCCIIVPCHRLLGGKGALTGYSGGIERKRWLLDHEARHSGRRIA